MAESLHFFGLFVTPDCNRSQVNSISDEFQIKLIDTIPDSGFYLELHDNRLELLQSGKNSPGPIVVEFVTGKLAHRLKYGGGRGQPLARAVGMKPGYHPTIIDTTAGLGRDGFILASLGSQITLCERSPILAALLQNGLKRAAVDPVIGDWVSQRIKLVHADSSQYLLSLKDTQIPDVVYIDPMYPDKKGSALVKKEMLALQQLLGPDTNSLSLFQNALKSARRRVVVKRPGHADWLHNQKPDTLIESKKTRYDIYVTLSSVEV